MKIELMRGGERWLVQQVGAQLFEEVDGSTRMRTLFDADAARAEAEALIAARRAEGWVDSDATRAATAAEEAERARYAALRERYQGLAAVRPVAEALIEHFAFLAQDRGAATLLRALFGAAISVEVDGGPGLIVRWGNGCRLECGPPAASVSPSLPPSVRAIFEQHERIYFYDDATSDHRVFVGHGAEPPEGDSELDGTSLAGHRGVWLMQEDPWDRYWLLHPTAKHASGEPALVCYELDGGLRGPVEERLGTVLLRIVTRVHAEVRER